MSGVSWNTLVIQSEGEKVEDFLVDADVASVIFSIDPGLIKQALFGCIAKFEKFATVQVRCMQLLQDCHLLSPPGITNDELLPRYDAILRTLSSWMGRQEVVENVFQLLSMLADRAVMRERAVKVEDHELLFYVNRAIALHYTSRPLQRAALQLFEAILENADRSQLTAIASRIFKPVLDNLLVNLEDASICYSSFSILVTLALSSPSPPSSSTTTPPPSSATALIKPWTDQILQLSLSAIGRHKSAEIISKCLLLIEEMVRQDAGSLLTLAGHSDSLLLLILRAVSFLPPKHLHAQIIAFHVLLAVMEDYDLATVAFQNITPPVVEGQQERVEEEDPLAFAVRYRENLRVSFDKFVQLCGDEDEGQLDEEDMKEVFLLFSEVDVTLEQMINDVPPEEEEEPIEEETLPGAQEEDGEEEEDDGILQISQPFRSTPSAATAAAMLVQVEGDEGVDDEALPAADIAPVPLATTVVAQIHEHSLGSEVDDRSYDEDNHSLSRSPSPSNEQTTSDQEDEEHAQHNTGNYYVKEVPQRVEKEVRGGQRHLPTISEDDEEIGQEHQSVQTQPLSLAHQSSQTRPAPVDHHFAQTDPLPQPQPVHQEDQSSQTRTVPLGHHSAQTDPLPEPQPVPVDHHFAQTDPLPQPQPVHQEDQSSQTRTVPLGHHSAQTDPLPEPQPVPVDHHFAQTDPLPQPQPVHQEDQSSQTRTVPLGHHSAQTDPLPEPQPVPVDHHFAQTDPLPQPQPVHQEDQSSQTRTVPLGHHSAQTDPLPEPQPVPVDHHFAQTDPLPEPQPVHQEDQSSQTRTVPLGHHSAQTDPLPEPQPVPVDHHFAQTDPLPEPQPVAVDHHFAQTDPLPEPQPVAVDHHFAQTDPLLPEPQPQPVPQEDQSSQTRTVPVDHHSAQTDPLPEPQPQPVSLEDQFSQTRTVPTDHHSAQTDPLPQPQPVPQAHQSSQTRPAPVNHHSAQTDPLPEPEPQPVPQEDQSSQTRTVSTDHHSAQTDPPQTVSMDHHSAQTDPLPEPEPQPQPVSLEDQSSQTRTVPVEHHYAQTEPVELDQADRYVQVKLDEQEQQDQQAMVETLRREKKKADDFARLADGRALAAQMKIEQLTAALHQSQEQTTRALQKAETMHEMFVDAARKIEALVMENERVWAKFQEFCRDGDESADPSTTSYLATISIEESNHPPALKAVDKEIPESLPEEEEEEEISDAAKAPSSSSRLSRADLAPSSVSPLPKRPNRAKVAAFLSSGEAATLRASSQQAVRSAGSSQATAAIIEALDRYFSLKEDVQDISAAIQNTSERFVRLFEHLARSRRVVISRRAGAFPQQPSTLSLRSLRVSLEAMHALAGFPPQGNEGENRQRLDLLLSPFRAKHITLFGLAFAATAFFAECSKAAQTVQASDLLALIDQVVDRYLTQQQEERQVEDLASPLDSEPLLTSSEFEDIMRLLEKEKKPLLSLFSAYTLRMDPKASSRAPLSASTSSAGPSSGADVLSSKDPGEKAPRRLSDDTISVERFGNLGVSTQVMRFEEVLCWAKDFALRPQLFSQSQLLEVFRSAHINSSDVSSLSVCDIGLNFLQFLDLVVLLALRCPLFRGSAGPPRQRLVNFFHLLNQSQGKDILARRNRGSELVVFRPPERAPVSRKANFLRSGGPLPVATAVPVPAAPSFIDTTNGGSGSAASAGGGSSPIAVTPFVNPATNSIDQRRRKKSMEELRAWIVGNK